jgi:hypothetical protein
MEERQEFEKKKMGKGVTFPGLAVWKPRLEKLWRGKSQVY